MGWIIRSLLNTEFYSSLSWKFDGFFEGGVVCFFVYSVDFVGL